MPNKKKNNNKVFDFLQWVPLKFRAYLRLPVSRCPAQPFTFAFAGHNKALENYSFQMTNLPL